MVDSNKHLVLPRRRSGQVLIVSEDLENREVLTAILKHEGWESICASGITECRGVLFNHNIGLMFCDHRLPEGIYVELLVMIESLNLDI